MSKTTPHIRLLGDEEHAALFIRPGLQELFRTMALSEEAGVPVYGRTTELNDYVTVHTGIFNGVHTVTITATPPPEAPEEAPEEEEEKRPERICPPGFIVYKGGGTTSHEGYILGYNQSAKKWVNAGWPEGITFSPVGGWWHLATHFPNLVSKEAHRGCDLITWFGNPNSMGDCGVWTHGTGNKNKRWNLRSAFYYQGIEILAPRYILGACITTIAGKDYYSIVGCEYPADTDTFSWLRYDGSDETIWRKEINKPNHATDDWELLGTVDYEEILPPAENPFIPPFKPAQISTAYVDENGIAWLTKKKLPTIAHPYWRILIKIDLKTGEWEQIYNSTAWQTGNSESSADVNGFGSEFRNCSITGDEYILTMGGMEARYDLFIRYSHADSYFGSKASDGEDGYLGAKTIVQNTNITLVIKKDGEEVIWSGPLCTATVECQANFKYDDSGATQVYTSTGGAFPTNLYWYQFLHPHMLDQTTYFYRENVWTPGDLDFDTTLPITEPMADSTVTQGFRRNGVELVAPTSGTYKLANQDFLFDARKLTKLPSTPQNINQSMTHAVNLADDEQLYGLAGFVFRSLTNKLGDPQRPFTPQGNLYGSIGLDDGAYTFPIASEEQNLAVRGFSQKAETDYRMYQPMYSAYHRPIKKNGKWSYLVSLPDILDDLNRDQTAVDTFAAPQAQPLLNVLLASICREDIDNDLSAQNGLWWIQGNSYRRWEDDSQFYATECMVLDGGFGDNREYIYTCLQDHISTAARKPPDGANWETYWERRDMKVTTYSNVLTQEKIEALTKEDHDGIISLGIL